MNKAETDELLIRLDVGMANIEKTTTLQEKHLARLNGSVQQLEIDNAAVKTTVYGRKSDKGLCGEVSTLRRIIYGVAIVVLGGGTLTGLEWADVISIFGG